MPRFEWGVYRSRRIPQIGGVEDRVFEPGLEALVVLERLEKLRLVSDEAQHRLRQRLVTLDAGVHWVTIGLGVAVGLVLGDEARDLLGDAALDAVFVFPLDIAEVVIEAFHDCGELLERGVIEHAAAVCGHGL